jgi:hypothetical protein
MPLTRRPLPDFFSRYHRIGGVLHFGLFADCTGTEESFHEAIAASIGESVGAGTIDRRHLVGLPWRSLSPQAFLGCWADIRTRTLRRFGEYTASHRRKLINPSYAELETLRRAGERITSGGTPIPDLWVGGQFAFAFADPPYGLFDTTPGEVQALFEAVLDVVVPRGRAVDIRDWGSPALADACPDYSRPGTERWGVFLFTVFDAPNKALTVIAGSSTD